MNAQQKTVIGYTNWRQAVMASPLVQDGDRVEFVHGIHGTVTARKLTGGQPVELGAFTQTGHVGTSPNTGWYYC